MVAADGQGRATIIWITNDVPDGEEIDNTAWRVRGATLAAGSSTLIPMAGWISEKGALLTFPNEAENSTQFGPNPRIALAVAPNGTRYAAWVRTVEGVRRIEVAVSSGFGAPFGPASPVLSACGSPSDLNRLHLAADDSGAHLVYMDRCVSSSVSRWRAVAVEPGGTVGTPFAISPETAGTHGPLVRHAGESYFVSIGRNPGSPLYLFRLGATQVQDTRAIVADGSALGAGWDTTSVTSAGLPQIATVARTFQGAEYKILLDIGQIGTATGADQIILDAVPGASAYSPQIAAGPDGSLVAAWFEDTDALFVSVRTGSSWSQPIRVPDPVNLQSHFWESLSMGVSSAGVAHVAWSASTSSTAGPGFVRTSFFTAIDLRSGPPYLPTSPVISGKMWPDLVALPDGRALVGTTMTITLNNVLGGEYAILPSLVPSTPAITNLARPAIRGKAQVGSRLKATPGAWLPADATHTYQWFAGKTAIKGGTKNTLVVKKSLRGKKISVRVTATAPGRRPTSATSKPTAPVKAKQ